MHFLKPSPLDSFRAESSLSSSYDQADPTSPEAMAELPWHRCPAVLGHPLSLGWNAIRPPLTPGTPTKLSLFRLSMRRRPGPQPPSPCPLRSGVWNGPLRPSPCPLGLGPPAIPLHSRLMSPCDPEPQGPDAVPMTEAAPRGQLAPRSDVSADTLAMCASVSPGLKCRQQEPTLC